MEFSVARKLPFKMMDGLNPSDSVETLEQHLAELQAMPDFNPKEELVDQTKWFIDRKKKFDAEMKKQEKTKA
jgi:hypothetical protein